MKAFEKGNVVIPGGSYSQYVMGNTSQVDQLLSAIITIIA